MRQMYLICKPHCNRFILERQWNGCIELKGSVLKQRDQFIRSAQLRTKRRNEHICIDDDLAHLHGGIGYDTSNKVNAKRSFNWGKGKLTSLSKKPPFGDRPA
jgi:hypothetical protein